MEKEIKEEELFIPKTKYKGLKILLAIILLGALAYGGYYLYKEKFSNPNKTVISIVEDIEKQINKDFNDKNIYKFNGVLKIDTKLSDELKPLGDVINNFDLQFIVEADTTNNIYNGTLNAKYKKAQLMDVNIYSEDKTTYYLLQDVYDKYLKLSLEDITGRNIEIQDISVSKEDIEQIRDSVIKAIKTNLNNLEFKRSEATIKIDDKDRNVYNNYVELKEDDVKKLSKDIVNTLSNDNAFIKVFKKLVGEEAKFEDLNDVIDKLELPGTYKLNFYTSKVLFNQKLVSIRFEAIVDDATTSINYDKISNDEILLLLDTSGGTISCRIKKTNSVFNVNLNVNILGTKIKLDLSSNYEKIKEVTKPDVSDSKKIEDLTDEEIEAIEEAIQSNEGMIKLIKDTAKFKPAP